MVEIEDLDTAALIALLDKYSTEVLSAAWVEAVVDADYTECDALPADFEDQHVQTNWASLLKETGRVCRGFVLQQDARSAEASGLDASTLERSTASSAFWTALAQHGIRHQHLSTLLFHFMHAGRKNDAAIEERELGLLSASIYLLLLAIPGSNAFRVFHPMLFTSALDSFKLVPKLLKAFFAPPRRSAPAADSDELVDDDDEAGVELEPEDINRLLRLLNTVLGDLLLLTERFSLRHGADSLEDTVQVLVELTRLEAVAVSGRSGGSLGSLVHNAFCCLSSICRPRHGSVTRSISLVLRALIPSLLMAGDDPPRALTAVRDRAVRFVDQLLSAAGVLAEPPLLTLVQNLCVRVPERAEQRQRAAQSVVMLLRLMPLPPYRAAVDWLCRFARHEKSGHRLMALELVSRLVAEGLRESAGGAARSPPREKHRHRPAARRRGRRKAAPSDTETSESETETETEEDQPKRPAPDTNTDQPPAPPAETAADGAVSHALLVRLIFRQCRDPAASVRSRALNVLAECTVSGDAEIRAAVRQLFTGSRRPSQEAGEEAGSDDEAEEEDIMAMLRRRANDDKVMVRKSSLQVIENIMRLDPDCVTPENLQVLLEHCRDPALLARKQCQSSLTSLVEQYPTDERVCEAVVRGLFPQIHDPENKIQERVVQFVQEAILSGIRPHREEDQASDSVLGQFVQETILSGIRPHREEDQASAEELLPWKLLGLVVKLCYQKYLNKIIQAGIGAQPIRPAVCRALRTHVATSNNAAAWMCLALISRFSPVEEPLFALDYFTEQIQTELTREQVFALQQCLHVLQFSVARLAPTSWERLTSGLTRLLAAAALPLELVSAAVDTLAMVSMEAGDEAEYQARLAVWCGPLIEDCEDFLSKQLLQPTAGSAPDWEDRLVRQIHTLGDLAQLVPAKVNKRCFLMLQNLIYVEKGGRRSVSGGLQDPSPRLQAVAIATLGKLCLQHEQMAKRVIPALGKILDVADELAVKNNVVFTLADMCVRYATLVDPLLPQVTCCLRDRHLVMRRNTLILLIRLLQEDYLKLKGTFFFRLIQCLVDPEPEIRELITFYLTERLLKRQPKVFFQHFVECLFLYNEYEGHESYNKLAQTAREQEVFSLRGPDHQQQRMHIYRFLLEHMPDDQRFQTSHKLCQDVLGGVVDGKITLGETADHLLHDALRILRCDEIKLQSLKTRPEDAEHAADASGMAEVFQAVAKKTLISQVVKKNVIENMVPIIIALKHKLERPRSPLLKELMIFLKDLMKDYKNEIQDILVADKQLAKEIEFDMKRLTEDHNSSAAEPPPAAAAATATVAGPAAAGDAALAATPRNKHIQSVLVEAIRSAHRLSARCAAAAPQGGGTEEEAVGGEAAPVDPASPELDPPLNNIHNLLRAISTPQAEGVVQNLTFVDRDVSAILRVTPQVQRTRKSQDGAGAETPVVSGMVKSAAHDKRGPRRGLNLGAVDEVCEESEGELQE